MFLSVPAHPGLSGQSTESRKTVVCMCVCVCVLSTPVIYFVFSNWVARINSMLKLSPGGRKTVVLVVVVDVVKLGSLG